MESLLQFKMTYYVGVMLAQGGVLSIKPEEIIFAPNSIERAMGATDTVIPYEKIKLVDITGTITESLMIRTLEKAHRFVGGNVNKIKDQVNEAIQSYQSGHPLPVVEMSSSLSQPQPSIPSTPEPLIVASSSKTLASSRHCPGCSFDIRPEFHYCPACKKELIPSCLTCHRTLDPSWSYCAFCGASKSKVLS